MHGSHIHIGGKQMSLLFSWHEFARFLRLVQSTSNYGSESVMHGILLKLCNPCNGVNDHEFTSSHLTLRLKTFHHEFLQFYRRNTPCCCCCLLVLRGYIVFDNDHLEETENTKFSGYSRCIRFSNSSGSQCSLRKSCGYKGSTGKWLLDHEPGNFF
jgi:hypothetical protein